ncbi:MAG: nicotinamide riboside transporter PnuC [Pseudomonadota bacterium]|nr:nicotinamide riboside transporter PnuC [Pseudomonadota bacterium]
MTSTIIEYLSTNWLGLTGFVSGLLCVWLLIRENIWTFPLGLLYSVVTVVVMYNTQLYADVLLNFYYVVMNAYGWFFWIRGGQTRRSEADELMVTWLPRRQWTSVVVVSISGIIVMGWYFDTFTNAAFAYADSFTTILSFVAMWMSARKYLDSWILWFIVNVASVVLYLAKAEDDSQLYFYVVLYTIYIGLAVQGWYAWQKHLMSNQGAPVNTE